MTKREAGANRALQGAVGVRSGSARWAGWLRWRQAGLVAGVLALGGAGAGCAKLLGIEESTCDPLFDIECACPADQSRCECYCQTIMDNCVSPYPMYNSEDACLAMCPAFEAGPDLGESALRCRINFAFRAASATTAEAADFCAAAGPTGRAVSGAAECEADSCVPYCNYMNAFCSQNTLTCIEDCQAARQANAEFDQVDYVPGNGGDTLQCRTYHVNNAAQEVARQREDQIRLHCGHASGLPPCAD